MIPILSREETPVWGDGMSLTVHELPLNLVNEVSKTDNAYTNNSSLITIVKYRNYTIAVTGDMETEGMESILEYDPFLAKAIAGTKHEPGVNFLICPHHGLPSGFCQAWFDHAGPMRFLTLFQREATARHLLILVILMKNTALRKIETDEG